MIWLIAKLEAVADFARAIGCNWIGEIAVSADASCDENTCHANVDRYILSHGGTRVLGYYMLESAWGYQAVLHSVWNDGFGNLIDITPFADQRRRNVFARLRDNQPLYKTNNIYSQSLDKYVQEIDVMYYVYALIDPRTEVPFYIGKGKGRRAKTHLWEIPETRNEHKENKIAAIRAAGLEPRIEYIAEDIPDESYAYKIEEDLIQKYGRKGYEPYGILTNICLSARPPNHRGKSYVDIYGPERALVERRKRQELQIARGGYGPKQHSAETKAKISQRSTGAGNGMYGRTQTDETKQKIRENRTPATGADHPLSRHWQLIAPDGTVYDRMGNLQALCDSVSISFATMAAAFKYNRIPNRGKARGWQVKVIK